MMFSETECMAFNPFENTKGDSNERIISDCIVTSRKGGKCWPHHHARAARGALGTDWRQASVLGERAPKDDVRG